MAFGCSIKKTLRVIRKVSGMITDEFLKWLTTAKGSELMKYEPKNDREKYLIKAELDKRIEGNSEKIVSGVFSFLADITSEDE